MLNKLVKSWWFYILLGGVVVRIIFMPITLHPDLWGQSIAAYFFAYQGKLNIFQYLLSLSKTHPLVQNFSINYIFIYPPLTYYTLGFFRLIIKPFDDPNFIPWLFTNIAQIHSYPNLFSQTFLYKLPYLFVDIGLAFLLANIFEDERKKKLCFTLWMFNPVSLYVTFMIGQNDILPTFFTVLSTYLITKGKNRLAMLSLGIGGSYKLYPLLFVLPMAFLLNPKLKERLLYIILGILPYLVTSGPFIFSSAYRQIVLANTESTKMLFMAWPVSGAEALFPFILGLIYLYCLSYYHRLKVQPEVYLITILLLTFSVTHYHPQWFLWVTPFLIWELIENRFKYMMVILIIFCCWLSITLLFEPSLSFGLFNPIWPHLEKAKGLSEILGRYMNVFQLKSLIRSVFAGASLYYILSLYRLPKLKI